MQGAGSNLACRATRIDRHGGIREEIGYLGAPGQRLITMQHVPVARHPPAGCVLIVPPLCSDFLRNYRREVLIGRELARRGIVVVRFHYRGTGNSEGDPATSTFDDLCADAAAATSMALGAFPGVPIGFFGTRFGALVAAATASEHPGAPLALADPILAARKFFREGFRARMAAGVKAGLTAGNSSEDLLRELEDTGEVDILGHSVHRSLFRSAADRSLRAELADARRSVLWLQFGGHAGLHVESQALVADLRAGGCVVDAEVVGDQLAWWFVDDEDGMSFDAVPIVADWMERQLVTATGSA